MKRISKIKPNTRKMISSILESKSKNQKCTFYVVLITCLLLIICVITLGIYNFHMDINTFVDYRISEKESSIESKVNSRYNEINYDIASSIEFERKLLGNKSMTLETTFNSLDLTKYNEIQKKDFIIDSITETTYKDHYLYYLLNTDNTMFASASNDFPVDQLLDETELQELMLNDSKNNYKGIYTTTFWSKEGYYNEEVLTYCAYLEEYDCILCIGTYYNDFTVESAHRAFKKIDNYYMNDNEYLYIMSADGKILSNLSDKDTSILENTKTEILSEMANADSKIIYYNYNGDYKFSKDSKISYAIKIPEYNAYLIGIEYMDDIDSEISNITRNYIIRDTVEVVIILSIFYFGMLKLYDNVVKTVIYEKKRLEDEEQLFNKLFADSYMALIIVNLNGTLIHKNDKAYQIFGDIEKLKIVNGKVFLENKVDQDTYKIKNIYGKNIFLKAELKNYTYQNQQVYLCYFNDVTNNYEELTELKEHAIIDTLTLIPNRRKLIQDSNRFTKKLVENNCYYVLAMIDIDWFKRINDEFGHIVGDEVLKILAKSFDNILRNKHDHLYRYGGEEFVLYLVYSNSRKAKKIIEEVQESFGNETKSLIGRTVHFSAGIIEVSIDDANVPFEDNIRRCDELLYKAKENGRNRIVIDKEYKK